MTKRKAQKKQIMARTLAIVIAVVMTVTVILVAVLGK